MLIFGLTQSMNLSVQRKVTSIGGSVPNAPVITNATGGPGGILYEWYEDVDPLYDFQLKISETSGGEFTVIASLPAGSRRFFYHPLGYGQTYYAVMTARNSGILTSDPSNEAVAMVWPSGFHGFFVPEGGPLLDASGQAIIPP
jgi:hypothetical protein